MVLRYPVITTKVPTQASSPTRAQHFAALGRLQYAACAKAMGRAATLVAPDLSLGELFERLTRMPAE